MSDPVTSWPPGSGITSKHWLMGGFAGIIAGSAAVAEMWPGNAGHIAHVVQVVFAAMLLQLGVTTNSIKSVRALLSTQKIGAPKPPSDL